jgi:hypothetical protein
MNDHTRARVGLDRGLPRSVFTRTALAVAVGTIALPSTVALAAEGGGRKIEEVIVSAEKRESTL